MAKEALQIQYIYRARLITCEVGVFLTNNPPLGGATSSSPIGVLVGDYCIGLSLVQVAEATRLSLHDIHPLLHGL